VGPKNKINKTVDEQAISMINNLAGYFLFSKQNICPLFARN
jgi:hypothetical protein